MKLKKRKEKRNKSSSESDHGSQRYVLYNNYFKIVVI